MKFLAQLFSAVFHPLLMPSIIYAVILFIFPLSILPLDISIKLYVLGFIFLTTAILPSMCIYVLYTTGRIKDLTLNERKERLLPNIFTCLIYAFICYLMKEKLNFNGLMLNTLVCITVVVSILTFITAFWKISLHATSAVGLVGFLFGLNYVLPVDNILTYCCLSILLAGGLMSSRLYLGAHNAAQIWAGGLLGFVSGWVMPVFFL